MMGLQFLGPILATVLYVIVFQKAGFRGPIMLVCGGALAGPLISYLAYGVFGVYSPAVMLLALPFGLLPLLVLAFKSWPPVGVAPNSRSET